MIILHNKHDKKSREFVDAHSIKNTVIDWYNDPSAVSGYFADGNPSPSSFPSIVDETSKVIVREPIIPDELNDAIIDNRMWLLSKQIIEGQITLEIAIIGLTEKEILILNKYIEASLQTPFEYQEK